MERLNSCSDHYPRTCVVSNLTITYLNPFNLGMVIRRNRSGKIMTVVNYRNDITKIEPIIHIFVCSVSKNSIILIFGQLRFKEKY